MNSQIKNQSSALSQGDKQLKSIGILDNEYIQWVKEIASRYKSSQIKAAIKVNREQLLFNWQLGRDIVELKVEERWGDGVIKQLCIDLSNELPGVSRFSKTNVYYCKTFYMLYNQQIINFPQVGGKFDDDAVRQIMDMVLSVPWGHHKLIIDKVKGDVKKALFYIHQTIENGWSRSVLQHCVEGNLYERQGKSISNFKATLPDVTSDLAQEITKDPYNFAFAGITGQYNEAKLKDALLNNITKFLVELGAGFAYVGKEYRLQIGETENFLDLLFYHLKLRSYVVIEVKVGKFTAGDTGQLGTYIVAVNHLLKRPDDNPTIGMLICKGKDGVLAKYSLEASSQPISISEFELNKLYPTDVEGMIPTIEELEKKLKE